MIDTKIPNPYSFSNLFRKLASPYGQGAGTKPVTPKPTSQIPKAVPTQQFASPIGPQPAQSPIGPTSFAAPAIPQVKTPAASPVAASVAAPVTPAVTTTQTQASPTPAGGVDYSNFRNRGGTIINTQTGKEYQTNEELANDLGIAPNQIDWQGIKQTLPEIEASPDAKKTVSDAETAYQESLKLSPEQLSTQEEIDTLIESTKKGYRGTREQAIPLEFITGQLKSIEGRALDLAEPLESKLARLEAARTSSLASSKFGLERADKKAETERDIAGELRSERIATEDKEYERGFAEEQFEEQKEQSDLAYQLSQQKFAEDKRQFGASYALQAQRLAMDKAKEQRELEATAPGKTLDQINFVEDSLKNAQNLAHASGRSGVRKTAEGIFVGSTDYTNLVSNVNTLRTNILSLMVDPGIKKFFGPQMTEKDVELMTATGTTLNPELQSSEAMTIELGRLGELVTRMRASLPVTITAPDGQQVELTD